MSYRGSCHCGRVAYEVDGAPEQVIECNCSHCSRKGLLLWFVPESAFRLTQGQDDIGVYLFNKHVIQHHFCKICGVQPYARGKDARGQYTAAINVRCLEGMDLDHIKRVPFDGRSR